jgi:hypothetical protein
VWVSDLCFVCTLYIGKLPMHQERVLGQIWREKQGEREKERRLGYKTKTAGRLTGFFSYFLSFCWLILPSFVMERSKKSREREFVLLFYSRKRRLVKGKPFKNTMIKKMRNTACVR